MQEILKIAIVGYGKMGHEIEKHALDQGMSVSAIIDTEDDWNNQSVELKSADVAIEFTSPDVVVDNLVRLFESGIPVVTGTTGWNKHYNEVKQACQKSNGSLFHASNFSVGVNLFFALNRRLAELISAYPEYRIFVEEAHHIQKLDAPSGTAISLLDDILKENTVYTDWKLLPDQPSGSEIPVTAIREPGVTGVHTVKYESDIDFIEIKHTAKNRDGFARGALMAAQWLKGRRGIFTMRDLLNL
jgi:4-hydroxy-tetrahydrodipicolinate reductase